ncbi:MAG: hypothetical protein AAFX87_27395 [Bacteroidota bacterium]
MKSNNEIVTMKRTYQLPELKDPKHPGIYIISRIALFSIGLFMILGTAAYFITFNITLDFKIPLSGTVKPDHLVLYADGSEVSFIETGDLSKISITDELTIEARVHLVSLESSATDNTYQVILYPTEDRELRAFTGNRVSATIFITDRPLWSLVEDKLGLEFGSN